MDTQPHPDEVFELADLVGEQARRVEVIEAQANVFEATKRAQDGAVETLKAALSAITTLKSHVLNNDLGKVSLRLAEVERQSDTAIRALETSLADFKKETVSSFGAQSDQRTELARSHESSVQQLSNLISNVRHELSSAKENLVQQIATARKEFSEPKGFNLRGNYDGQATYSRFDVTVLNGSSFVSTEDNNTEKPSRKSKRWQEMARRGAGGGSAAFEAFQPNGDGRVKYSYSDQFELYIGKYEWADASPYINGALDITGAGDGGAADAHGMLRFKRSGGTLSSPTAITIGDYIGSFSGMGYDGTAYAAHSDVAVIIGAAGNFTDTSHPTQITFWTTNSGSISKRVVGTFNRAGDLLVGDTTTSNPVGGGGVVVARDSTSTTQLDSFSSAGGANAIFMGRRAFGSIASPSAVGSGTALLAIHGRGYGTNTWGTSNVASIVFETVEAFTNSAQGTQITFGTTPIGSTTRVTALTLTSAQNAEFAGSVKTAAPSGGTAGVWKFGVAASVSPTSPNRTIELDIGGTIYYLHAKTTNN